MIRSASSQEDESVFLDEGLFDHRFHANFEEHFFIDEPLSSANTDTPNSFFAENYEHEDSTIDEEDTSIRQLQRRKSVSSRFRSVSKEITYESLGKKTF